MLILRVSFGKINIIRVLFESGFSFKWKNGVSKKELATKKKDLECRRKNEREREEKCSLEEKEKNIKKNVSRALLRVSEINLENFNWLFVVEVLSSLLLHQ